MGYNVKLSGNGMYILQTINSPITLDLIKSLSVDTNKIHFETNVYKILSDCRNAINQITVSDTYVLANNENHEAELIKNIKTAIVISEGDDTHYHFETFALNAGFNIKIFINISLAEKWLLED